MNSIIEAKGFGFQTADKLALKLQPDLIDSPKRLIAFMKTYLGSAAENDGNTWADLTQLKTAIINNVPQCTEAFDKLISLESNGEFGGYFYFEDNRIGLSRYRKCENSIYDILVDEYTSKIYL